MSGFGLAETHVSVVFFVGDRAYKLKKPVRTPFLDFSTPQKRRAACLREVELNRRLAPDVYLGVADVTAPAGGEPCDHLVVMRRMPPERRLAHLVASGAATPGCLEQVAGVLAAFHARAATSPQISAEGTRDALRHRWEDNISEMLRFAGMLPDPGIHDRVANLARSFLEGRKALFDRRMADGRIRDGHGDLLADDVFCLDDGPRILDCLEFDDRLRYVDVLDDTCCLAMDLEHLGNPEAATTFLTAYRDAAAEDHPASLAHHYIANRAHVRAKVAFLRHEQGDGHALERARRLLGLARAHLTAGQVTLVLVGGLPGTGKSTLARGIGEARGWRVLRSDDVRNDVVPADPADGDQAGTADAYGSGRYAPAQVEATYEALLDRARPLLGMGESVVLDASWTSGMRRAAAAALAGEAHAELVPFRCSVPPAVAAGRVEARRRRGGDPSEATPAMAMAMAAGAEPWPEAITIDTSAEPGSSLRVALGALDRRATPPAG